MARSFVAEFCGRESQLSNSATATMMMTKIMRMKTRIMEGTKAVTITAITKITEAITIRGKA
jgi:hypothetical protein